MLLFLRIVNEVCVESFKFLGGLKMNKKVTSPKVASKASKALQTSTSKVVKKAAASTLSQTKAPKKQTGTTAAKAASKVLRSNTTSKTSKSAAGSALAQKGKR